MKPLRVVLVMIDPPSPFGNAAARDYYVLLKGLVERGHRVTAFATSSNLDHSAEALRRFPPPDYDLRIFPVPPPIGGIGSKLRAIREPHAYLFSPELRRSLAEKLSKPFDVLHLEQVWSGWVGLEHANRAVLNVHFLYAIDKGDGPISSPIEQIRSYSGIRAEQSLLRFYPRITTLTPRLTDRVRQISPSSEVRTIPLGIDTALYDFSPEPPPRPPTIALIGSFSWLPTLDAARRLLTRLWPEIRQRVPEVRLQLVGRQAKVKLGMLANLLGVEVFEDVPDTLPYFRSADVLLYPTPLGSGMKVKVMEAFALGTPVVTTPEGVEGLPARDGVEAGIANDDAGLIDRTLELLRDPARRVRLRVAARSLLEDHCGPGVTLDRVEAVYDGIVAGGSSVGGPKT
jgi:polysaccharide biosynthesis protein PslH